MPSTLMQVACHHNRRAHGGMQVADQETQPGFVPSNARDPIALKALGWPGWCTLACAGGMACD